jgi:hypothetical protein
VDGVDQMRGGVASLPISSSPPRPAISVQNTRRAVRGVLLRKSDESEIFKGESKLPAQKSAKGGKDFFKKAQN